MIRGGGVQFWAATAIVWVGCTGTETVEPTQTLVIVDAEPGVRGQTGSLRIVVRSTGTDEARLDEELTAANGTLVWPWSVALEPLGGDASRGFRVEASARDADGRHVAQARAVSGYVKNQQLTLRLLLQDACRGVECGDNETCEGGSCISANVNPGSLPPLEPGDTSDAGVVKVDPEDLRPADASIEGGDCVVDVDCDDGVFCNGREECIPQHKVADDRGCVDPSALACLGGQDCDEDDDRCLTDCEQNPDADGDGQAATECGGRDCDDTRQETYEGAEERCDGFDNDCSSGGAATPSEDRDKDGFSPPQAECEGGYAKTDCDDGDRDVHPDARETCNDLNDDCDDETDENLTDTCGDDTGSCVPGLVTCSAGSWGSCMGAIVPVDEVCNGKDDDCDGNSDEQLTRVCGMDTGDCVSGTQDCDKGLWGVCDGQVTGSLEICDGEDNDCDTTTDEDATCNPNLYANVDTMVCGGGDCDIDDCDAGYDDCNTTRSDGCEEPLNSLSHCGACFTPCGPEVHTVFSCATQSCAVADCVGPYQDCQNGAADGCETPVNTNSDCGDCGVPCAFAGSTTNCISGVCLATGCVGDYDDCDGDVTDGCESLNTATHCGACDEPCHDGLSNVQTASCDAATCDMVCDPGYGNCANGTTDGCEQMLNTPTHCGDCGDPCGPFDNAGADCGTGTCQMGACTGLFFDCNDSAADGCEHDLGTGPCPELFTYAPSNFDADLPDFIGSPRALVSQSFTIDTTDPDGPGAATVTSLGTPLQWGGLAPNPVVVPQPGGPDAVLLPIRELTVPAGVVIKIIGDRPLIVAVGEDAIIDGHLDADAEQATPGAGGNVSCTSGAGMEGTTPLGLYTTGSGGGGFGTAGGRGGTGWNPTPGGPGGTPEGSYRLVPLRGGCPGADGFTGTGLGGAGGGAIQVSVAGTLSIGATGKVSAAGGGGMSGTGTNYAGGAGGGSGGAVLMESEVIDQMIGSRITTNGGGGGGARFVQDRPPGEDGHNGDNTAAAGGATDNTTIGAPGGDGGTPDTAGQQGGEGAGATKYSGGGGGGGHGRIRVRIPSDTGPAFASWSASNFTPQAHSYVEDVVIDCAATFDSTGPTPSFTTWCSGVQPTPVVTAQAGGPDAVIIPVRDLELWGNGSLDIIGDRPVIFAVDGKAHIDGTMDASASGATPGAGGSWSCTPATASGSGAMGSHDPSDDDGSGGGGGGGGALSGGSGGSGHSANMGAGGSPGVGVIGATGIPLRGGCQGGNGGTAGAGGDAGAGGGAVQISARWKLAVAGSIDVSGGGGVRGDSAEDGGGGGGAGGAILLEADGYINAGALRATGGGGAAGNRTSAVSATSGLDGSAGGGGGESGFGGGKGGAGGLAGNIGGAGIGGAVYAFSCGMSTCFANGAGGGGGGGAGGRIITP